MGKIIIVLTILIGSDMVFHWGLPLGGVLFIVWALLAGGTAIGWKEELKQYDSEPVDKVCVALWWIPIIGFTLLGNSVLSTIVGFALIGVGILFVFARGDMWELKDATWRKRKYYVCFFYAVFLPLLCFYILKLISDMMNKEK